MLIFGAKGDADANTGRGQNETKEKATGTIVGTMKPRLIAYSVWLSMPGAREALHEDTVDSRAKFVMEGVQPGSYTIHVEIFNPPFGHCGFFPWTRDITVRAGETVRVKATLKRVPNARCE